MHNLMPLEAVDYLMIGHLTRDVVPGGFTLGGTASYAALTARALGLKVGIVTSCEPDFDPPELAGIPIVRVPSDVTSTFENIYTPEGRIQYIHNRASDISLGMIPETWRRAPIVHLGPVAQEVDPNLVRAFPGALIAVTPQGWMRRWDKNRRVHFTEWVEAGYVLSNASAAVMSVEDVENDERTIEEMLYSIRLMVVTEGAAGCRLYWNGDLRRFRPPAVQEVDPVGAGDIFATSFFIRYHATRDPWEAARFATLLAAQSVTRRGLKGVPTSEEAERFLVEVIPGR